MFHVELRQFPNMAREFNLEAEDLQARIVRPWLAGRTVELGERKWAPERARLTIYEGPRLRPDELGMGRGWANATRGGEDVTARLLEQPRTAATGRDPELVQLKQSILDRCADRSIEIRETVELAGLLHAGVRASERLALAEQAVWELLHTGSLRLIRDGAQVDAGEWQPVLLAWGTWSGGSAVSVSIARS
jgi:hypothetical protein